MRYFLLLFCGLTFTSFSIGQSLSTIWSEKVKLPKGSTDFSVIFADETGIYVKEGHVVISSYFMVGATSRSSATLIKYDKSFSEAYRNNFNKELKGKEFENFFFIHQKAYLIASAYNRKEQALEFFAAEINKNSGELKGDWETLASIAKDEKTDQISKRFTYNADSTKMIMVSANSGKKRGVYEIQEFDENMKKNGKAVQIRIEYDPNTFLLEDLIYTVNGNTVMVGRVYDYAENKKKKRRNLEFQNYSIMLYDHQGVLIKDIATDLNGKWLASSKVAQIHNRELIVAAFYSNQKRSFEINGMMVQRINALTGDIISTSLKDLSTSMIDDVVDEGDDDQDDESRKERVERKNLEEMKEDDKGFSRDMRFKDFIYSEDGGLVILAEKYYQYTYSEYSRDRQSSSTYAIVNSGDIMMSKIDAEGQISWLHILPKFQYERHQVDDAWSRSGIFFNFGPTFFSNIDLPFFSGLGVFPQKGKNTFAIIFNDNSRNDNVLQAGQKVYPLSRFYKAVCYAVFIDAATGKYERKSLFNSKDKSTAMPRFGKLVGDQFYIICKDDKVFGKSKIAICKLSFR